MKLHNIIRLPFFILTLQLFGCSSPQGELERVAKDWCATIRASQVIPVYPLTEDLEPGDVFLVMTPVSRQAEQYKKKGFLPLDMHMARLSVPVCDFNEIYNGSFGLSDHPSFRPPHIWAPPNRPDANCCCDSNCWRLAPHVAFPTYTFKVERKSAVQAALPIEGIPVAIEHLAADKAVGSVAIKDSYTYGVPYDKVVPKFALWAGQNKALLRDIRMDINNAEPFTDRLWRTVTTPFVGKRDRTVYLRIINRVYLAGSVTVSLTNTSSTDVNAEVKPLSDKNPLGNLTNISDMGASLSVDWDSERSVRVSERFERPLVIGYLAFDFPVLADGRLGTPVSTISQFSSAVQTRQKQPLPPSASLVLTGFLGRVQDDLYKIAAKSSDTDIANDANICIYKLDEAASRILYSGKFDLPCTFGIDKILLTEKCESKAGNKTHNLNDLISLWKKYEGSVWALDQGIKKIRTKQQLHIKYSDKDAVVLEPVEADLKKLTLKLREYKSRWSELDNMVRSAPEISEAVEYYMSLFTPNN